MVRAVVLILLVTCLLFADESSPEPVRVCEILEHPESYGAKPVFVVGRYSFREHGLFLGEATCNGSAAGKPAVLELEYDAKTAPKPPEKLGLDASAVKRKLAEVRQSTSLGKFKFGSPDYDRWALVYGRVEFEGAGEAEAPTGGRKEFQPAPGRLVCRGAALVVFIPEP